MKRGTVLARAGVAGQMRFPITLKLLAGKKWRGKLRVDGRHVDGYLVSFDAEDPSSPRERFVYDRMVLTPAQLEDWTGWVESAHTGQNDAATSRRG